MEHGRSEEARTVLKSLRGPGRAQEADMEFIELSSGPIQATGVKQRGKSDERGVFWFVSDPGARACWEDR